MDITKIDKNFIIESKIDKKDIKFYKVDEAPFNVCGVFRENGKYMRMPESVAKTVNEILDKAIEDNKNILSVEEKQEFQAEVHNVKNNTAIKREAIIPTMATVVEEEKEINFKTELAEEKIQTNAENVKSTEDDKQSELDQDKIDNTKKEVRKEHEAGVAVVSTGVVANEDLSTVATEYVKAQQKAYKLAETLLGAKEEEKKEDALTPLERMAAVLTGFGVGLAAGGVIGAMVGAATAEVVAEGIAEVKKAGEEKENAKQASATAKPTEKKTAAPKKEEGKTETKKPATKEAGSTKTATKTNNGEKGTEKSSSSIGTFYDYDPLPVTKKPSPAKTAGKPAAQGRRTETSLIRERTTALSEEGEYISLKREVKNVLVREDLKSVSRTEETGLTID